MSATKALESEIINLKNKINTLTRKCDDWKDKCDELLKEEQQLRIENQKLRNKTRQDSGFGSEEESEEIKKLITENGELKEKLSRQNEDINSLSKQVSELAKRPTEAEADAAAREVYEPCLDRASKKIINLESQIKRNNSQIEDLKRQKKELEAKVSELEKDLVGTREGNKNLEKNERLKRELKLSKGELNRLKNQKRNLITERDNALQKANQWENHNCSAGADDYLLEELRQKLEKAKQKKDQTKKVLQTKESKISELTSQLNGTLRFLYDLQDENKELVKRPSLEVYQELKKSFTEAQATLTTERKKATKACKKAQQAELINTELTEKLEVETKAKERAESNLTLVKEEISNLQAHKSEVELLEKLVTDLHQQNNQLLDNYSQEKIAHDLTKNQLSDTEQNLQDLQTENHQLQIDIDRIIAERDARPDISQSEHNNLVQKTQKLGKEEKKVSLLQKKAQNVRKELTNKKTICSQIQEQLTNEQSKTASLQASLLSEQINHNATKTERDDLLSQLTNANTTLATYEDYLKNELKIIDLTDLPILPAQQSLTDLIIFFNVRSQHNCFNPLHDDYDNLKVQLKQVKNERDQLAAAKKELKKQKVQIENDYHKEKQTREKVEQERDNYRQQLSQQEKEIITKFITELKLINCNENSSPEKIIATIQQLLIKPDTNNSNTPCGESLTNIKRVDLKMLQNLSIIVPKKLANQIECVNSYQGLVDLLTGALAIMSLIVKLRNSRTAIRPKSAN
ncbi:4979_t:CDS:2 [Entrophospora sp. SA101]|nr:9155_t:CDS:2 [Entrophospora sp. SA101]CAJ0833551.1 4979_t:CDS:2 [Entrophospora sp. SA101]